MLTDNYLNLSILSGQQFLALFNKNRSWIVDLSEAFTQFVNNMTKLIHDVLIFTSFHGADFKIAILFLPFVCLSGSNQQKIVMLIGPHI